MKSLTLVLCVIAILGSAASTFFYFQIGKTKDQLQQQVAEAQANSAQIQAKLTETAAQSEALQKRLASLDSDLGDAKSKSTSAESRSTQLTRDISQLRNQLTAKDDAEKALNREISQLKRELAQSKLSVSSGSNADVEAYKQNIATLQARVNELEASRGSTVAMAANTTASNTAADASSSVPAAAAGLKGEVVSIGAQNAFVILNVGSAKGVQAGQQFTISRGGNSIATAQISSVQENYSVAQIATNSIRGGLNKGDTAALSQ